MTLTPNSKSIFGRTGFVNLIVGGVVLLFANSSALTAPNADTVGSESFENSGNSQFDYMHTQAEWEMLKERSYPSKTLLDGPTLSRRYKEATTQLQQLQEKQRTQGPQPQPPATWTNIGPAPVTTHDCSYGEQNSGRIVSLAIDPNNQSHWLIAAHDGGIWETLDGGSNWHPTTDDISPLWTDGIAFAPSNPSIVYGSLTLAGLVKSARGGRTWTVIQTDCGNQIDCFSGRGARAFAVSPSDYRIAVAALEGNDTLCGIYRTTDGGSHWSQKLSHGASALVSVAGDFTKQYAAIGQDNYGSNGLYRSTDSGQSWQGILLPSFVGTLNNVSLAIASSNSSVLYVWAEIKNGSTKTGQIWKSTNAWDPRRVVWTTITPPIVGDPPHGAFGRTISVDPDNQDIIYAGEADIWKYVPNAGWTKLTCPPSQVNRTHVDFYDMQWLGSTLFVTNDGGIFRSTDKGNNWQSLNGNLSITEFYWASLHPTNPGRMVAGVQDNGTPIYTGTNSWWQIWLGDGMSNAISLASPDTHWLVSHFYQNIYRSVDGATIENVDVDADIDHTCAPFFSRFVSCPASDNVVIAGTDRLWRSTNNVFTDPQPHWSSINGTQLPGCTGIRAIEFARPSAGDCNTYAYGGGPNIRATIDNGQNWLVLAPTAPLPNAAVTDLAFDPVTPVRLYATFSGFSGFYHDHLFVCTDIRITPPQWRPISTPLDAPYNAIAVDPLRPSDLYVGTDLGLLVSTDTGASWTTVSAIPKLQIWDIQINRTTNTVVVFTYGRGAYSGTLLSSESPGVPTEWHPEPENNKSLQPKTSLLQRWWFGIGVWLEHWSSRNR